MESFGRQVFTESRSLLFDITKWYVYTGGIRLVGRTVNTLDPLEEADEQSVNIDKNEKSSDIDGADVTNITVGQTKDPPDEAIPLDVVFDILRNRRRRLVLSAIEEWDGSTTLSELAEHIGGIENSKPPHALNAQERKRVYVGLYQCHLPKMDDAGAIEFDQNRGTVERGSHAEVFHTYLDRKPDAEPRWYRYYGPLAGIGCVGVALSAFFVSSLLSVVAAISLFAVLVLAIIHTITAADVSLRERFE